MSDAGAQTQIAEAILRHAESGVYPENQDVITGELSSTTLPAVLQVIGNARNEIQHEIREISSGSAADVDGWISQAKQLQADIERSKQTAREIVLEAEAGKTLRANVIDAGSKTRLLREELRFNQTLADTLEQLQIASGVLDSAKEAISEDELLQGLDKLENAEKIIAQLDPFETLRFPRLLRRREVHIRELLSEKVLDCWGRLITARPKERLISFHPLTEDAALNGRELATAMSRMNLLDGAVSRLHRELDHIILGPRFTPAADGAMATLQVTDEGLRVSGRTEESTADDVVNDLRALIDYINTHLPPEINRPLLERILPALEMQLVSKWLDPVVPVDLTAMTTFGSTIARISNFAEYLASFEIDLPSDADLTGWIDRLPQTWLARRREAALDGLRSSGYGAVKSRKSAELVETQVIADDDIMHSNVEKEDDWNDWEDNDNENSHASAPERAEEMQGEEDEDVSAWGMEDEEEPNNRPDKQTEEATEDGEDAEAWGWGDDNEEKAKNSPTKERKPRLDKPKTREQPAEREITLREAYAVTELPDTILQLMLGVLDDASTLASPDFPIEQLSAAAPALATLPTLLLACYRATASAYYASDPAANMLMYNDTQRLSSIVTELVASVDPSHPLKKRLRLDGDIRQLETFAKRAYGREMDSQRTIVRDLLSSANGFVNCSAPMNAREYRNTVIDVAGRIRDVDKSWTNILSQSARLQSIGSLLGAVISKMVEDILELSDESAGISEEQSKVLKELCDQIATLSSLFEQKDANGEVRTLVGVYVPGWLRFMYLAEVLEASLAYIKDMWTDYGLHLEFSQDEIIDLIEALFADSDYRRNAIKEIRASEKGF